MHNAFRPEKVYRTRFDHVRYGDFAVTRARKQIRVECEKLQKDVLFHFPSRFEPTVGIHAENRAHFIGRTLLRADCGQFLYQSDGIQSGHIVRAAQKIVVRFRNHVYNEIILLHQRAGGRSDEFRPIGKHSLAPRIACGGDQLVTLDEVFVDGSELAVEILVPDADPVYEKQFFRRAQTVFDIVALHEEHLQRQSVPLGGGHFTETTRYDPHSPYSASKASGDHFVRAFHDTYGLPAIVTNCSNNYGPCQFPEKLIPLFINNIRHGRPLPVYGRGENVRDWLYVEDHARAIDTIFHRGRIGETYNIGGGNERSNMALVRELIRTTDRLLGRPEGASERLITHVADRPGHDLRYAIDASKLRNELGWRPEVPFGEGLERTVRWYLDNGEWLDHVTSGAYERYYERMYGSRAAASGR